MLCTRAVEAALQIMDPDYLTTEVGNFWGIHETRPYMRARFALAQQLWTASRRDDSIGHLRELLRLNPEDNQGIRYMLAGKLLEEGRDEEVQTLLKKYDEPSTFWIFSQTLAAFRKEGDTPRTRLLLDKAAKSNRHVVPLLLEAEMKEPRRPAFYFSPGDVNEAETYFDEFIGGWRQTPGAITWLRRVVADSKLRRKTTHVGPTARVKKRLLKLPQRFGAEWQSSVQHLPTWLEEAGGVHRPWSILAVDSSERLILGQEMVLAQPTAEAVFDLLAKAMEQPLAGKPHRPSEIQVYEHPIWEEIRPHLEEIGVDCINRTELDEVEFIESQMKKMFLAEARMPGLVESPGVELAQVGSLFAAAAEYYQRAPWRRLPPETVIEIGCDRFRKRRNRPLFAVVMGQNNLSLGLALYYDRRAIEVTDFDGLAESSSEESNGIFSMMFSEAFEISIVDLLACEENHWPLGGPEAYPMVIRATGHFKKLPLESWEFQFLEGCLRAIPRFVEQHELLIAPASETITVSTAQGELELKLSWEPEFGTCGEDCDDCHDHCEHDH